MGGTGFLIFIVILFAAMYFIAIRPQRRKQQAMQEMLAQLKPGDEVVTVGGIYGDVVEVDDDKVVLEIAEDVQIEVARRAIAQIVQQEPAYEEEPEAEEAGPEAEAGEGPEAEGERAEEATEEPAPVRGERRWRMFGSGSR